MDVIRSAPALLRTIGQNRRARAEVENYRDRQLRKIVAHAYANVPFYRLRYDEAEVDVRRFRGYEDLYLLPVLTKQEFRAAPPDDLLAVGVDKRTLRNRRTQGTTGEPTIVRRSPAESVILRLYFFQAFRSFGVSPRDMSIGIRFPIHGVDHRFGKIRRAASALRLYPREEIDAHDMDLVISELARIKPAVIGGVPSVISILTEHWARTFPAQDVRQWLKFVHTGGEPVDPGLARRIKEVFGVPVRDTYASMEFGLLAWECLKTGLYHTSDETVAIESLTGAGSPAPFGQPGLSTATALHSFASPIVRYQLGDLVTLGPRVCPCGAPFSTIKSLDGRTLALFWTPDNRLLSTYRVQEAVTTAASWIRQSQLVRDSADRFTVRVACTRPPTPDEIEVARLAASGYMGPSIRCDIRVVPDFATSTGKFRPLIDNTARDAAAALELPQNVAVNPAMTRRVFTDPP